MSWFVNSIDFILHVMIVWYHDVEIQLTKYVDLETW